ncbi:MAG: hypothetical protein AAF604_12230 [Acidobacteriota bacterium]
MNRSDTLRSRLRWLGLLRASLIAGAAYDVLFAALMVLAPQAASEHLAIPLPGPPFYLPLIAVFLLMLAALYLAAAEDPRRYSAVILVAIFGRAAGAVVLGVIALRRPDLPSLYLLAAADAVFALTHFLFWRRLRT